MMRFFRRRSRRYTAEVARDRLKILLAHERSVTGKADLVGVLKGEILAAVAKHVPVAIDHVCVNMDRGETISTLQIDIQIPVSHGQRAPQGCKA